MVLGGGRVTPGGNGPSRAPTPIPSTVPSRRTRSSSQASKPTVSDIKTMDNYEVKDSKGGGAFLQKTLLCLVGEPFTLEHLSATLFHITQMDKVPLPTKEAIRAVAFLLEEEATLRTTKEILSHVTESTAKEVASQVIVAIAPHIASLSHTSDLLASGVQTLEQSNATTASNAHALSQSNDAPSYSAIVKGAPGIAQPHSAAIARAATRERQVLLDPQEGRTLYAVTDTNTEIVKRLAKVIEEIRDDDSPKAEIKAVARLRNGGLTVEFDDSTSAKWIQQDGVREKFLAGMGVPTDIKRRLFPILVPFLAISHDIDDPEWLRSVEMENNLAEGAIIGARWVKRRERRGDNQRVAHAILTFTDPCSANMLLRDGLYVCKTKLHPRKDKRNPIRCAKCQHWGHIAKDCKADHDTCARCARAHRTEDCQETTRYCINCRSNSHGSNEPHCPTFVIKCAELDAKLPENSMPYYPTREPWTHVSLPPKPTLVNPPRRPVTEPAEPPNEPTQRRAAQPTTIMHQSTLDGMMGPRGRGRGRQDMRRTTLSSPNDIPLHPSQRHFSPSTQSYWGSQPRPENLDAPLPPSQ